MSRRSFAYLVGVACAGLLLPSLPGCSGGNGEPDGLARSEGGLASRTFFAFDTVVTVRASCSLETLNALEERCSYFESIFSRTIDDSDIGRVNSARGKAVEAAPETVDLVSQALRYCEESKGLFDISIGAVSELWDFQEGVVPSATAIQEAVKHVDYRGIRVEGSSIRLDDPQAKLDLGGIAKGYIADDLCRMLVEAGCTSGFVNLGGNVKTIGARPDGSPWRVGIKTPDGEADSVLAVVDSTGSSVVTSGLYERQFERDGKRYWHILDPKTGYPVKSRIVSASIVSEASLDGDGYTKPLFMMEPDEALAWIAKKPGVEALLVCDDGSILQTGGCKAELV